MEKPSHITFDLRSFKNDEIQSLLKRGENFRDIRPQLVAKYLASMEEGRWEWGNGETITFDSKGRLINGQHRLAAAREFQERTGETCWFWCAHNVASSASLTMDLGRSRTLAEYLRFNKVPYYNTVAAIVLGESLIQVAKTRETLAPIVIGPLGKQRPDLGMCVNNYRRNKDTAIKWGERQEILRRAGLSRPTQLAVMLFQFEMVEPHHADLFYLELVDGGDGSRDATDPIAQLRSRLFKDRIARAKIGPVQHAAITIKAWVSWLRGEPIRYLGFRPTGPTAEQFPSHIVPKDEINA